MGMFKNIFNSENSLFKPLGWLVDLVCLSVCWCLGAVLILPFGAVTAGLYDGCARCVRQGKLGAYGRMWDGVKENFLTGALLGVPMLAACFGLQRLHGVIYALADTGSRQWGMGYAAFWVFLAVINGIFAFLFPLLSRFEFKALGLLSNGVKLAIAHLPTTFLLGVWTTACVILVATHWLTAFFVPCLWALGATVLLERVFRPYMEKK